MWRCGVFEALRLAQVGLAGLCVAGLLGCEPIRVLALEERPDNTGGGSGGGAGSFAGASGTACSCDKSESCLLGKCVPAQEHGFLALAVGAACMLTVDDSLWCWGRNASGELGLGDRGPRAVPTLIDAQLRFREVSSASGETFCAITTDNALYCWGGNPNGALGTGETATDRASLAPVDEQHDWQTATFGSSHACARRNDGAWWCWGRNTDGELGLGDKEDRSRPTMLPDSQRFARLAIGWGHTCALDQEGALWCWGRNDQGQLGLGDRQPRSQPSALSLNEVFVQLTCGNMHCCAIATDASLWCWGSNFDGELGLGDAQPRSLPTRLGTASWLSASAGAWSTCAVDEMRRAWCWGNSPLGVYATAEPSDRLTPELAGDSADFRAIATGGDFACGLRAAGSLWCWGGNSSGELGQNDFADHPLPVEVMFAPR